MLQRVRVGRKNSWIPAVFWGLDMRTAEQMQHIAHLLHQMVQFDPLVYHLEKKKFFFWMAYDSRHDQEEIQQARAARPFAGRLCTDCLQTGSDDLAMVAFISKKILRLGYYEVTDDLDDLRAEALVQFEVDKAMRMVFSTLMTDCTSNDVYHKNQRARTILRCFREEMKCEFLDPELPLSIKFGLNGKQVEFRLNVREMAGADEMLEFHETCL